MSQTQTVLLTPCYSGRTISCSTTNRTTVRDLRNRISKQYIGIVDDEENIIFKDEENECLLSDNDLLKDNQKINLSLKSYPTYTSAFSRKVSNYFNLRNKDKYDTVEKKKSIYFDIFFVILGAVFIFVCSQLSFFLPWNKEVPVTLQTFAVLLNGAVQGPLISCLSVILYIFLGSVGVPVFANFSHGYKTLTGYTGGFFIGFIFSSLITGYLSRRGWDKQYRKVWLSMLLGNLVIYIFGFSWFLYKVDGQFWYAIKSSVLPFIPGDICKIALASVFIPLGWKLIYFRTKSIKLVEDQS